MKVILLQDVAKLGRRFSIVDVPSGHALNKLIPQGLAEEATFQNVKNVERRLARGVQAKNQEIENVDAALMALQGKTVTVQVEANDQGHLFEALKPKKIAEALGVLGVSVSEDHIHINELIKETGEYSVHIGEGESAGSITVIVEKA